MTTIVDYGAGNLRSVQNTFDELGASYLVTNKAEDVRRASRLVLPGVGHFGQMMSALDRLDLRGSILESTAAGVPFFGICVGLQALFQASEESPDSLGLGIFAGTVKRFVGKARIPHMGWNTLTTQKPCRLLAGLPAESFTYFAHSYYAPLVDSTAATCNYIQVYSAILERDNVFAVQFHPEKSGAVGLAIMQNFLSV